MQNLMKAVEIRDNLLVLASLPCPEPKANEVLIKVKVAGVNRPDVLQRQGKYPVPPGASPLPGLEVAGEIVAVGKEVTAFKAGDLVTALTNGGGYAEFCTVPALQCLPFPAGVSVQEAAALPETFFTVWSNLFMAGGLAAGGTGHGKKILVHGGSGGIGMTAIKLAKAFGATVFTTAGSREKCEACRRFGADYALNYREQDFAGEIEKLTAGQGVNLILDSIGASYFERNLRSLDLDGRLIIIGLTGGAKAEAANLGTIMRKRLVVTGSTLRPRPLAEKAEIAKELREKVWPLLEKKIALPEVDRVFPLEEAQKAHDLMESGRFTGKIVLQVGEPS